MPITPERKKVRVTFLMYEDNRETLIKFFGRGLGYQVAARQIIDRACKRLNEKTSQALTDAPIIEETIVDD